MEEKTALVIKITEPEAFQLYLEMGVGRSHIKLQEILGERSVALRTIGEWSSKYNWVDRADQYDRSRHDEIMKIALKKAVKSKVDILTICQSVLGGFSRELIGEEVIIKKTDRAGNTTEKVVMNRYHPDMADVERAYKIIKEEIGEGLPDFGELKEINLTAIFQQIFKNAKSTTQPNMETGESERP